MNLRGRRYSRSCIIRLTPGHNVWISLKQSKRREGETAQFLWIG